MSGLDIKGRKIVFITGGARSGKSSFALKEASKILGNKAYIATAEALDEEMKERIEKHKKQRGNGWDTYEEPVRISEVIKKIGKDYRVIVIDCLTLWLSNLMHAGLNIINAINDLIKVLDGVDAGTSPAPTIYVVSNEVGMGIVPDNELARRFRDMAGILNQKIAGVADKVYMVVAGIPVKIKDKGEM